MSLVIPELDSISPQLSELDKYRAASIPMCRRANGQVVCQHTTTEKVGQPFDSGIRGYSIQKVKIIPKDGATCTTCKMPKFE